MLIVAVQRSALAYVESLSLFFWGSDGGWDIKRFIAVASVECSITQYFIVK
jgi:hypothetical protein